MQRILETPIQRTPSSGVLPNAQPYLQLTSELDEQGRTTEHELKVLLSRDTDTITIGTTGPSTKYMRQAENAVDVPWRAFWLPHIVRATACNGAHSPKLNQGVLWAFSHIEGVDKHNIDLSHLRYEVAKQEYYLAVERGGMEIDATDVFNELVCLHVKKVALAAAGLRLARATTLMNTAPLEERIP